MGKKAAPKAPSPPPEPEEPVEEEKPEELVGEILDGDFVFPDGSVYEGQYLKSGEKLFLHGRGSLRSGPEMYQGTFEKGSYKMGRFTSCNGAIYKGNFRDNLFHGTGEYTWPDGRKYRGMWQDGQMHGPGEYTNFAGGAETAFKGVSLRGKFNSAQTEDAHRTYKDEYSAECVTSARNALRNLAERAAASGPPRQYVCPQSHLSAGGSPDEPDDVTEDRALVEGAMVGPFPEASLVPKDAARDFAAGLAEDAAQPLVVRVYEETDLPGQRLDRQRLKLPQLQYVGQAVEFALPGGEASEGAEAGTLIAMVLVNIAKEYDIAKARWKIAHVDAVPPAVTE